MAGKTILEDEMISGRQFVFFVAVGMAIGIGVTYTAAVAWAYF